MACRKFIKNYDEATVLFIAKNNYVTTWTDYAKLEFFFQAHKEKFTRLSSPKDITPIKNQVINKGQDLRSSTKTPCKKGLFERLEEIENG